GRERPLPVPLGASARKLARQRGRQPDAREVNCTVPLPELTYVFEVSAQVVDQACRQHGAAVLVPFAAAHDDLSTVEVEVVNAQAKRLEQPQPAAVEESRYQTLLAPELGEERADLVAREDDGQPARP